MKHTTKPRIVIDTNVWISGLIFGGGPERVIRLFVEDAIVVVVSEELLSELRRNITQKFPLYIPQLDLLEASLRQDAELVKLGSKTVHVSRDSDDDKVIETALIGNCSYIVSGDNDLLVIDKYEGVEIVKPVAFLKSLDD